MSLNTFKCNCLTPLHFEWLTLTKPSNLYTDEKYSINWVILRMFHVVPAYIRSASVNAKIKSL